jgi:hypothetical protein
VTTKSNVDGKEDITTKEKRTKRAVTRPIRNSSYETKLAIRTPNPIMTTYMEKATPNAPRPTPRIKTRRTQCNRKLKSHMH